MKRRRGRWTYVSGLGWQLDDSEWILDFDRLDSQGERRGAYELQRAYERDGQVHASPVTSVDHYLDGAMEYVECAHDAGCTEEQILRGEVPWPRVAVQPHDGETT